MLLDMLVTFMSSQLLAPAFTASIMSCHLPTCMQAAKEVAHLHTLHPWSIKGRGTSGASTALPIWQEQALTHLNLSGPNPDLQIMIGGDPPIDARLLAALRILYCRDPTEMGGRPLVQLGAWGAFLTPANEVCSCR